MILIVCAHRFRWCLASISSSLRVRASAKSKDSHLSIVLFRSLVPFVCFEKIGFQLQNTSSV